MIVAVFQYGQVLDKVYDVEAHYEKNRLRSICPKWSQVVRGGRRGVGGFGNDVEMMFMCVCVCVCVSAYVGFR